MAYGPDTLLDLTVERVEEIEPLLGVYPVLWVDVDGYEDRPELERLAALAGLHPLAMEDVLRGDQRAKAEGYPDHLFLVLRMLSLDERVESEQINLFLTSSMLVTLQAGRPGDCLDPVRARVRAGNPRLRGRGADHLLYALVDTIIDGCFPVLDAFGARLEALEQAVVTQVEPAHASQIQLHKHDLFALRRTVIPMGDAIQNLVDEPSAWVTDETRLYFRDVHDHTHQLIDGVDAYREAAAGLMDIHLAAMNNRMGEVMKVLTVISTVFIPLSFIAGVYGMNFDPDASPWNMPELRWFLGYPFALMLMTGTALGLLVYFRTRRWLG